MIAAWPTADMWNQKLKAAGIPIVTPVEVEAADCWGDIVFVACWQPPADMLAKCHNLKAVMSLGAGVDHLSKKVSDQRDCFGCCKLNLFMPCKAVCLGFQSGMV